MEDIFASRPTHFLSPVIIIIIMILETLYIQCWVRDSFSRDETETRQLVFETETRQRHLFSESAETRTRPRQLPSRPRRDRDNTAETVNETLVISTQCCRRGAALQLSRMVLLLTNALHLHKSTSLYGPMRKR